MVTVNAQVAALPALSLMEYVTTVAPTGKIDPLLRPEVGELTGVGTVITPSTLSCIDGEVQNTLAVALEL
jgi:hypothetical protein